MRDSWDGYAFWFPDDKTGWSVSLGWDMVEACSGTFERDVVHWTDKLLPGEEPRLVTLNRMDGARTQVWPFKVNDCDLFTTVPPLASGISELRVFDNDWTEDPTESSPRPNANVWGWMVHGTLAWTADGSAARFSFTQWTVWHKEGSKLSAEPVMQKLMLK
jgi:hypothetical protein